MKIDRPIEKSPALTRVMPLDNTTKEKIDFLKEQISELKQQKKCYDKMIRQREKAIKYLTMIDQLPKMMKKINTGIIGSTPGLRKKPKKRRKRST